VGGGGLEKLNPGDDEIEIRAKKNKGDGLV